MSANGDQVLNQEVPQARDKRGSIELLHIGRHVHVLWVVVESLVTKAEGNLRLFRMKETSRQMLKHHVPLERSWTARIAERIIVFTLVAINLKMGVRPIHP